MFRVDAIGLMTQPESKVGADGKTFVNFSIACRKKNKKTGEKETQFVTCTAFGRLGDTINRYMRKGDRIYVSGEATLSVYQKRDGSPGADIWVAVDAFEMLGSSEQKEEGDAPGYAPAQNVPEQRGRVMDEMAQYTDATGIELPF